MKEETVRGILEVYLAKTLVDVIMKDIKDAERSNNDSEKEM